MTSSLSPRQMAWLLASISAIMPFAIDAYLPAVVSMATSLQVSSADIQQNLSLFLFGQAIGLLIGGSASDIKGRKPIVLIGLSIFTFSSFALAWINSLEQLMLARFVQAIGAGMIAAMSGAIVRDYYDGQQAAQMFALIGLIMMMAPLIAPSLGSALHHVFGWRSIFVFLAVYAFVVFLLQVKYLPQRAVAKQTQSFKQIRHDMLMRYLSVFQTRPALGFLFVQAFSFSAMFCFLTESPFVYMQYFALSETHYALVFALNLIAMMSFNRITAWKLKHDTRPHQILLFGLLFQLLLNVCLFTLVLFSTMPPLPLFVLLVMMSIGTQGFIGANTQACFMQFFKEQGGSANGVMLSCQALIAGAIGYLTTQLHDGSLLIMPMMMLSCSILAVILLWTFSRSVWQKNSS